MESKHIINCFTDSHSENDQIWRKRFAHLNSESLKELGKCNIVDDLNSNFTDSQNLRNLKALFQVNRMNYQIKSIHNVDRSSRPLQLLHTELVVCCKLKRSK